MFGQTKRLLGVLAGTTGLTLALGVGASTGLVPKLANSEPAPSDLAAAATVTEDVSVAVVDTTLPPTTVVEVTTSTVPPTTAAPKPTTPPTTRAPAPRVAAATTAPPAAPAVAEVVSTLAARTVPSAQQVSAAIAGIQSRVQLPLFFQVTPAHVADIGNQICTAFDQGQTFTQVKATGLATVSQYVPVSPDAADYAVRTAVAMYCPGYASRLG